MQIGEVVRIRPAGASLFTITGFNDEGRPVIESVADVPGRYPFSMKPEDLMPADQQPSGESDTTQ